VLTKEEIQQLGPDEVLVRIRAVSLNFTELLVFDGSFPAIPKVIPCSDMAGDVVSVGANVSNVKPGDRVTAGRLLGYVEGQLGRDTYYKTGSGVFIDGVLADSKVLPAASLVVIPEHLSYEEGSTLPCVAVTAYNCLFGAKPVQKGDTLLLMGTGGLNMFAAQFASTVGVDVIITSSSDEKIEQLKEMGYTKFVNYVKNPDWDAEVLKLTDGVGASHIIECGGMGTLGKSIACVKMGGWIHAVGFLDKIQKEYVDITFEAIMKNCIVRGVFVGPVTMFKEMNDFITEHQLRPMIDRVFEFEDAITAFEYLEKKVGFGKIVIRVP
jgi:NADPH:quinone reductase-like Zn-dependent oxidoreductase